MITPQVYGESTAVRAVWVACSEVKAQSVQEAAWGSEADDEHTC